MSLPPMAKVCAASLRRRARRYFITGMPVAAPNANARWDLETAHAFAIAFNVSGCCELRSMTHTALSAIDMLISSARQVLAHRLAAGRITHLIDRPVEECLNPWARALPPAKPRSCSKLLPAWPGPWARSQLTVLAPAARTTESLLKGTKRSVPTYDLREHARFRNSNMAAFATADGEQVVAELITQFLDRQLAHAREACRKLWRPQQAPIVPAVCNYAFHRISVADFSDLSPTLVPP